MPGLALLNTAGQALLNAAGQAPLNAAGQAPPPEAGQAPPTEGGQATTRQPEMHRKVVRGLSVLDVTMHWLDLSEPMGMP